MTDPSGTDPGHAPASGPEREKELAARAAAELVHDGMTVGLGTGSTVARLLPALAGRRLEGLRCVATSPQTEAAARALGIPIEPFGELSELDIAIDGADQVAADGWLIKGGGGAHLREKIVARAAVRFVVICDSGKAVDSLHPPTPVELMSFGLESTRRRIEHLGELRVRDAPVSPDGGVIADLHAPVADPVALAADLDADPGVSGHGLFAPDLVSEILIADGETVRSFSPA